MDFSILWLLPGALVTVLFAVVVFFQVRKKDPTPTGDLDAWWENRMTQWRYVTIVGICALVLTLVGWLIAIATQLGGVR